MPQAPTRVLVLGANGMLGSALVRVLDASPTVELTRTVRAGSGPPPHLDARADDPAELVRATDSDWVLNAIGVLRSAIDETKPESVAEAMAVNAEFPRRLAASAGPKTRLINFGTDAVFAGDRGPYDESRRPDADDAYARSKLLGESDDERVLNLRCSLIGLAPGSSRSLLGWALTRPPGATIGGYDTHLWNGLTTWHLARLCEAVVLERAPAPPSPLHLVPADAVTKAELLRLALTAFGRDDVDVSAEAPHPAVDLRLATRHGDAIRALWAAAGYPESPTIATMVEELARVEPHPALERR